jgi:hypothetical protein
VVAEASRGYGPPGSEPSEGFDLPAFLDELSQGFAAEGALPLEAYEVLRLAEPAFNPDLAMLGLQRLIDESDLDAQVPDLHRFLDTDLDGLLNADDNCRYAPNPDQALAPEGPHGAACDTRLAAVSATDLWGCGVLAADSAAGPAGGVVCWEVRGAETGGSPPLPDVFPAAQRAPWGEESPFAGADGDAPVFTAVAVSSRGEAAPWVCAALDGGGAVCWDAEAPGAPRPLPELSAPLLLSAERVCGAASAGAGVACAARSGGEAPGFFGEALDFAIVGDDHLCVVDAAGALRCQDGTGADVGLPAWAGSGVAAVGGNTAGGEPFACAVLASDGAVRCVDLDPASGLAAPPPAPAGSGYADVSVGLGTACAWTEAGALCCGRFAPDAPEVLAGDAVACPEWSPPPDRAWKISMGACYACGVDGAGFGACWPDDWSRARGEGEPIGG